jgi:hypothetical protein
MVLRPCSANRPDALPSPIKKNHFNGGFRHHSLGTRPQFAVGVADACLHQNAGLPSFHGGGPRNPRFCRCRRRRPA